jgi:protein TonB
MFEQSILTSGNKSKRFWTTCLGISGEAALLAVVVVTPMVWPQALPRARSWMSIYTPTAPSAAPRGDSAPKATRFAASRSVEKPHGLVIPTRMPPRAEIVVDEPPAEFSGPAVPGGIPGGTQQGSTGGLLTQLLESARPAPQFRSPEVHAAPAPRHTAAAVPPPRIRLSSMQSAKLLSYVKPAYPPLARTARVSGTVELEAVIGTDGRLTELHVKSGNPLLVPAAVDAVRQWVYQPTVLNGEPVEVLTTILVNFTLGQ